MYLLFTGQSSFEFLPQAKEELQNRIKDFVHKIQIDGKAISEAAAQKIQNGDVLMVYGWYVVVTATLSSLLL